MNEPLISRKDDLKKWANEFREMADRMELNADGAFGGCFVVIDPNGNIIKTLILDSNQDPAQFWGVIKSKCDMALNGLDEQMRNAGAFGRR